MTAHFVCRVVPCHSSRAVHNSDTAAKRAAARLTDIHSGVSRTRWAPVEMTSPRR